MSEIYEVVVTREGDAWLAEVPDLEGLATFADGFEALVTHVREAIALTLDLPEGAEAGIALRLTSPPGEELSTATSG